jgi:GalNAc-alpha-(1->4)-GalNAc-alpha-(1->3)-diNAcBac-PP-undecaprenol alpha-1,4-N-acetyl-D-galactosaminyltransferase
MGKKFVLFFRDLHNVHLFKDVGMVPFILAQYYGFDSEILCNSTEDHNQHTRNELAGLKITCIRGSIYSYLREHARDIDVLMLFHIKTETMYVGMFYKLLNAHGILYVKYDLDDKKLLYATWGHRNFITQAKRNLLFTLFKKQLDLISIENKKVYEEIAYIRDETKMYLPNGFWKEMLEKAGVRKKKFSEKENLIILVGRHGSRQKNSEFMFDVLERMGSIGDWRVCFIGDTSNEFEERKASFLSRVPDYSTRINCVGAVTDKRELLEYYNKAKIFCLPSRWEGFPLVGPEALCFGNVLLMTREVASSYDLTGDNTVGFRVGGENVIEWADCLSWLIADQALLEDYSIRSTRYFEDNFDWKTLCGKLSDRINSISQRSE